MCQYYWCCYSYSVNRRSVANFKKIRENSLLVLQMCIASPTGTAIMPRFTHKHGRQRNTSKLSCGLYIVPILLELLPCIASLVTPILAYKLGSYDQKRRHRWNQDEIHIKRKKNALCHGLRPPTRLLTIILTHLNLCLTLPLKQWG